jgi:hypothetical protein
MSIRTRNFFDRIQNSTSFTRWRLPTPPHYDPAYWDRVYKDSTPDDCLEWGGFDLTELLQFRYEAVKSNDSDRESMFNTDEGSSTFAELMDVKQYSSLEEASQKYQERRHDKDDTNEAIVLLGSGNSKMGEQLLVNSFQGPFLHIDVSSKVIQCMAQRYDKYLKEAAVPRMKFIVDDASEGLTSLEPESVGGGVVDKGLLDGLHCSLPNLNAESNLTSNHDMIQHIMTSVHRVLRPSRPFVFFSRSSPEFMLRRAFGDDSDADYNRKQWTDISVVKLIDLDVMLYRFVKAEEKEDSADNSASLHVTTRGFRNKKKQKRR